MNLLTDTLLDCRIPFGAQLRHFIQSEGDQTLMDCPQCSSPAWRICARDQWIGWTEEQRTRNRQLVINNSRFLIFPWVKVKNLVSAALGLAAKTVPGVWFDTFGCRPALLETLVDQKRYHETSDKSAHWLHAGDTPGQGCMDRENKRQGMAFKDIYLLPASKRFRQTLM